MRCSRSRCSAAGCADGCTVAARALAAAGSRAYGSSTLAPLNSLCSRSLAISGAAWRDLERAAQGRRMLCECGMRRPCTALCAVRTALHSAAACEAGSEAQWRWWQGREQ